MRERRVVEILAQRLMKEGFLNVKPRYGSERGVDLEAQFPDSRRWLYIEAKGERPGSHETAKRRVVLGEALFQIFNIYDDSAVCAIALPNTRGFRNLARGIFGPLSRLGVHVLFIGEDGEVWHLDPKKVGLPHRVPCLREELESS